MDYHIESFDAVVTFDAVTTFRDPVYFNNPIIEERKSPENHTGFGPNAQKRFRQNLDKLNQLFYYGYKADKNYFLVDAIKSIKRKDRGKYEKTFTRGNFTYAVQKYYRKPVFLTVTFPVQGVNDYEAKAVWDQFLQELKRKFDLRVYIWKAEIQTRGVIHFHCVADAYIYQDQARRIWWKLLNKNNCLTRKAKKDGVKKASNIIDLRPVENLEVLKFELSGYFANNEITDQDVKNGPYKEKDIGKLKPKKKELQKKGVAVRHVNGKAWGCCNVLKDIQHLKFKHVCFDFGTAAEKSALFTKVISIDLKNDRTGEIKPYEVGKTYIFRQKYRGKFYKRSFPGEIEFKNSKYWSLIAREIYQGKPAKDREKEEILNGYGSRCEAFKPKNNIFEEYELLSNEHKPKKSEVLELPI